MLLLVAVAVGLAAALWLSSRIQRSVRTIVERLSMLRENCTSDLRAALLAVTGGDLTVAGTPVTPELSRQTNDEIGDIADAVGAIRDNTVLGPVLALGLGGRRAGLDLGAAFRLLPITDAEADELIDSAEGVATELDGFRGSAVLDREALRELILCFTRLLVEVPEVVEADLKPVRCKRRVGLLTR